VAKYFVRLLAVPIVTLVFTVLVIEPLSSPHRYGDTKREWTPQDSKAYAYDKLGLWRDKQMSCLSMLWGKESAWNPKAYNKIKVQGRNAGGIPQLLGLDPDTPATLQIERGLDYIYYRYGTPCNAWSHFKRQGWY